MSEEQPEAPRPINRGAVLGGAVLGWLGSWFLFALALLVIYAQYGDNTTTIHGVILGAALLVIPVVSGALMVRRRTRQLGAGLLMGVAIGSLIGAGICAGTMVP